MQINHILRILGKRKCDFHMNAIRNEQKTELFNTKNKEKNMLAHSSIRCTFHTVRLEMFMSRTFWTFIR